MDSILDVLDRFLRRRRVCTVNFARGQLPPPEMAHLVNFPRVAVALAGENEVEIQGRSQVERLTLAPGDALVIPPNCWDRPSWTRRGLVLNVLFGKKQAGLSLVAHNGENDAPPVGQKMPLQLPPGDAVHDIVRALLHGEDRPAAAPTLLQALLVSLRELARSPAHGRVRKAAISYEAICLYVQANFAFPITRESVAEHFHLSPNHVSRLFQREGLTGFSEYVNRVRVDRAKYLLRNHPLALDAVAYKSGYRDAAYFCRVFKRLTKMTPTEYREQKPKPSP